MGHLSSSHEPIAFQVNNVGDLRASLGHLIDNVGIVFYVIERDEEYCFYVLDRVYALLPSLSFRVLQILRHLLQLTQNTAPVLRHEYSLQKAPLAVRRLTTSSFQWI